MWTICKQLKIKMRLFIWILRKFQIFYRSEVQWAYGLALGLFKSYNLWSRPLEMRGRFVRRPMVVLNSSFDTNKQYLEMSSLPKTLVSDTFENWKMSEKHPSINSRHFKPQTQIFPTNSIPCHVVLSKDVISKLVALVTLQTWTDKKQNNVLLASRFILY